MPTLDSKNGLHRLDDEELEMLDNGAKKSGLLNGSNSAPNNVYEREVRRLISGLNFVNSIKF